MNILKNNFTKNERLCGEKEIESLYNSGFSFLEHPLVFYVLDDSAHKVTRVLVSVSKRKFKRAVQRNLLKRRMREAYRLHKSELGKTCQIGIIYVANQVLPYQHIEKAITQGLQRISKEPNLPVASIKI